MASAAGESSNVESKTDVDEVSKKEDDIDNQNLLTKFWNLASLDEEVRISACIGIVKELRSCQKKDDLDYTVKRLVKGLSSSRKAARQGYAVTLAHLLKNFIEISNSLILELIKDNLAIKGSFKGQEERDNYFGQLFGYLAVAKARIEDGQNIDTKLLKTLIADFLKLMETKIFLQEACGKAVCELLNKIEYDTFQEQVMPLLEHLLFAGWSKTTPGKWMIVKTVENTFQVICSHSFSRPVIEDENMCYEVFNEDLPKKFFKEHWNKSTLFNPENFVDIAKLLKETTEVSHPRVHFLWNVIEEDVINLNKEDFAKFWKILIEDHLIQSTHERKFLALNLAAALISRVSSDKIEFLLTASLIRCIINSSQSKENYLYNAMKTLLGKLPNKILANKDPSVFVAVIKELVGRKGHVCFDAITKSKLIETLTVQITYGIEEYLEWLVNVFVTGTVNCSEPVDISVPEKETNLCRAFAVNQLYLLIKSSKIKDNEEKNSLQELISFLFLHGFFKVIKETNKIKYLSNHYAKPVSESTQLFCRQKFFSTLTELSHKPNAPRNGTSDQKGTVSGGLSADGDFFSYKVLLFAKVLLESPKYVQLTNVWTPEVSNIFIESLEFISDLKEKHKEGEDSVSHSKGAELLFTHATLQLFSNGEEAADVLKDLMTCYKKSEVKKKQKKKGPHWTEVLTEILFGFLTQSSNLMRQVVDIVYPSIIPHLTDEAFQMLTDAIKPKKKDEEKEAFDIDDPTDEDDLKDELTEGQENGNDAVDNNGNIASDNETNVPEESSNSEGESSDDEDDEIETDEQFKSDVKAALGDSVQNSEEENHDEVGSSEEDIDMDTCDPKLLKAMDQQLAAVFLAKKLKQQEKKKQKDIKQSLIHFRLRVLDLVEIFIKKQPKNPKILDLLQPLLEVLKYSSGHTNEQHVFERTLGIFKNKLCQLREYPSCTDLNADKIHTQIKDLINLAKIASSVLFVTYITQGIVYLIRVLRGSPEIKEPSPLKTRNQRKRRIEDTASGNEETTVLHDHHMGCIDVDRITRYFKEALHEFMTKRSSHLQPVLFTEYIQRFPSLGWKLSTELPDYLNNACNNFRKMKALDMLQLLITKKCSNHEQHLSDITASFCNNVIKVFDSTEDEKCSLKSRQFQDVVHLVDVFLKTTEKYKMDLDLMQLKDALMKATERTHVTRSPSLLSYCQKVIKQIETYGVSEIIQLKSKKT